MSVADQILAYLKVVTWPAVVLVALVLFRAAIRRVLGGLQEFEGFGIRAKLGQQLADGIDSAAQALDDSPVTSALSPAERIQRRQAQPDPRLPTSATTRAQAALVVSSRLAMPDPGTGDDSLDAMRAYLRWLDTAITAVIVVLGTADALEPGLSAPGANGESGADLTPRRIERQLSEVTGVSGWRGVIEARTILSGTVVLMCGKGATAISQAEARRFVRVAMRALDQWQDLVKAASEAARQPAAL